MASFVAMPIYSQANNPPNNNQTTEENPDNAEDSTTSYTKEELKAMAKAQKLADKEAKKMEKRAKKERDIEAKEAKKKADEEKKLEKEEAKKKAKEEAKLKKRKEKELKKSKQNGSLDENSENTTTTEGDTTATDGSEPTDVAKEETKEEKPKGSEFIRFQIETAEYEELLVLAKATDVKPANKNKDKLRNELLGFYGFPALEEGKVNLKRADKLYQGNIMGLSKKLTTISGNAQIFIKEGQMTHEITAEKIDINQTDKTINAYGKVLYRTITGEKEQKFNADEFVFSSATFDAMTVGVVGSSSNVVEDVGGNEDIYFFYTAKRMAKGKDNLIVLNNVVVSTCDDLEDDMENPHYSFKISKIWAVSPTEFAAKGLTYYVGHVPMFYLPVYYQKDIFINPAFYYDQRMGFGINTTVFLKGGKDKASIHMGIITGDEKYEDDVELKLMLDYYSKLGLMGGIGASTKENNFDFVYSMAYSRTVFQDYYIYQGPLSTERDVNHGYMFGVKVPFRFGLKSVAKVGDLEIKIDTMSDPYYAEDFYNRTESGAFFSMLGKKTGKDDTTFEEQSETESYLTYVKKFDFDDNAFVDSVDITKISIGFSAKSVYDSRYSEYSPNREFYVPKQLNMPDIQFGFGKQWYLNKSLEEKNRRKQDRFDKADLNDGERVDMSGNIVDKSGKTVETDDRGYRLNASNEPIFKDGKLMNFDKDGNIVDLLGNKLDRYGKILYYDDDGRRVDERDNLIDKDGNFVERKPDGYYRNGKDEIIDKEGEKVFIDPLTDQFYNRFGQTLTKDLEVDKDAPENQDLLKKNDFNLFTIKPKVEEDLEREWQPSIFYKTIVNQRIFAEPDSSQWTKPEQVKFKSSDFTNYGSFSNEIGIGVESSDNIFSAKTTVNLRGSYQTALTNLADDSEIKQTNSSKNEFSAGQGFNFQLTPFPKNPQLSQTNISYTIDFDYYQNYYNSSTGEQENKVAFMPTNHNAKALIRYDLNHFYFFASADYTLPTLEVEGSYLGGIGVEIKGLNLEAGAYGEMRNEPTDSSGMQFNATYNPLTWIGIGSETQITYDGKMNYQKAFLKISGFETGAVWERREQFNWDKGTLIWNPELDSNGESVYRFGFSQYYTKIYEEINIKVSKDGRVRSALLIDGEWTLDFEKYNDSKLRFGLGVKIDVDNEFEFMLKLNSFNDATYLYFDGMSDALGIPESNRVGFFEDLMKSFAFWDKETRQESNFKLGSVQMAITVGIHDWDLIVEYIGEPETNSSDIENVWGNTLNIMIVFKAFPDAMNTAIKNEYGDWSSHKDGSIF